MLIKNDEREASNAVYIVKKRDEKALRDTGETHDNNTDGGGSYTVIEKARNQSSRWQFPPGAAYHISIM